MKNIAKGIVSLAMIMAATASMNAQTVKDLSVEQAQASGNSLTTKSDLSVIAILDRADATYAIGETIRLAVKPNKDAYITVVNVGPTGNIAVLFPNKSQKDNFIKSNVSVEIPPAGQSSQIKITGPVGAELIKVIATSKPIIILPDSKIKEGNGLFGMYVGGVAEFKKDLAVVETQSTSGVDVAISDQIIKTIEIRPSTDNASTNPSLSTNSNMFPLLLASDKVKYKVGEPITIGVTSLKSCHLLVASANASGQLQQIFPSTVFKSDEIAENQALIVSGQSSSQTIVATEPGVRTITALCTSNPRQNTVVLKDASQVLGEQEASLIKKDLSITTPTMLGQFGYAQITIEIMN